MPKKPIQTHDFYMYKGDSLQEYLPPYEMDNGVILDTREGSLRAIMEGDSGHNYVTFTDVDFKRQEDKGLIMEKPKTDAGLQSIIIGGIVRGHVIYTHSDGDEFTIHELKMEVRLRRE